MRRRTLLATSLAAGIAGQARAAGTPSVLELFTSQGCSSCPPADRLLGQLVQRPGVIGLAWHVDYWNRLGWQDPFSSAAATARQKVYARSLGEAVYTPALVIGGARMVVGSDAGAADAAIKAGQGQTVAVGLSRAGSGQQAEIDPAGRAVSALWIFYLPEHTTQIGAGENGGRRLTEFRIVSEAQALGGWDGAARRFELPAPPPGHGAVLLVQSADFRILGAAELPA
jgi:hypothetical protein